MESTRTLLNEPTRIQEICTLKSSQVFQELTVSKFHNLHDMIITLI